MTLSDSYGTAYRFVVSYDSAGSAAQIEAYVDGRYAGEAISQPDGSIKIYNETVEAWAIVAADGSTTDTEVAPPDDTRPGPGPVLEPMPIGESAYSTGVTCGERRRVRTRKVVWFAVTLFVVFVFLPLFLIWAQFVAGWALDPLFQYWPVFYAVAGLAGAGVLVFEWATNRRKSVLWASSLVVVFAFVPSGIFRAQFAAALDPLFRYLPVIYAVGGLVAAGGFVFEWTTSRTSRNIALPGAIFGLLMFLEGLLTVVQDGRSSWLTQVLTAAMLIPVAFMVRGAARESEEEG